MMMKIIVYFLMFLFKILMVLWVTNPSIVFDQRSSNVCLGRERLISGSILEEDIFFDSVNLNFTEWESLYDNDWDTIPPLLNAAVVSPSFQMSAPTDRPRKLSISDIIDVLNLQEDGFSVFNSGKQKENEAVKYEDSNISTFGESSHRKKIKILDNQKHQTGFHHGLTSQNYQDGLDSPVYRKGLNSINYHKRNLKFKDNEVDKKECFVALRSDDSNCSSESSSVEYPPYDSEEDGDDKNFLSEEERDDKNFNMEVVSNLLNTADNAVILVMDKNKNISCVSTSKKKLEKYFDFTDKDNNNNNEKKEGKGRFNSTLPDSGGNKNKKRRGRKRIHQPDKSEDIRLSMRRQRNNEASKLVRHKRKLCQSELFEKESALIQNNLTLKTQLEMMTKQVDYMKTKLGMKELT